MSKKNTKKVVNSKTSKKNIKKTSNSKKTKEKIEDSESSEENFDFEEEELEEKNKIEKEIKGEFEEEFKDDTKIDKTINKTLEKEKKPSAVKKTKKQATIDSILDAYDKLNISESDRLTPPALKATKLNILERKLAELVDKMAKEIVVPKQEEQSEKKEISDDFATECLYNVNIIMSQFVENMSEVGRQNEMTKDYIPNLNGLTKRLVREDKQKALKECLKQIIKEHGETLKPYMSPIAMWAMLMMSNCAEQIAENASKNSDEAITLPS